MKKDKVLKCINDKSKIVLISSDDESAVLYDGKVVKACCHEDMHQGNCGMDSWNGLKLLHWDSPYSLVNTLMHSLLSQKSLETELCDIQFDESWLKSKHTDDDITIKGYGQLIAFLKENNIEIIL